MKRIYLILAVLGCILPYAVIGAYLLGGGPDFGVLFERFLANQMAQLFAADLLVSALVFLVYSWIEARRLGMRNWWAYLLATMMVGLSFGLPLFLYFREDKL